MSGGRGRAAGFPEARRPGRRAPGTSSYAAILRGSLRQARTRPALQRTLLFAAAIEVVWGSLDEYLPLLAVEAGASLPSVPLLGLLVSGGMSAGAVMAWRAERLGGRGFAAVLVGAAALLAAGALMRVPAGFVLIAAAFALFQSATVVADARLQNAIDGPWRSTITSLASLLTELLVLAVFAAYALGSLYLDHATVFALAAASYVALAVWACVSPPRGP